MLLPLRLTPPQSSLGSLCLLFLPESHHSSSQVFPLFSLLLSLLDSLLLTPLLSLLSLSSPPATRVGLMANQQPPQLQLGDLPVTVRGQPTGSCSLSNRELAGYWLQVSPTLPATRSRPNSNVSQSLQFLSLNWRAGSV